MVRPSSLRVVFFGTPAFAVPTLDALLGSIHPVVAVVTQPDRPSGRGQRIVVGPVKARALERGLPVLQPDRLSQPGFLDSLTNMGADLGVVAAYGKILSEAVLGAPRLGMINVHASLLPRHRGAAPVHRAVISGDTQTGVTIMRMVRALDAGPVIASVTRPIGPDETSDIVENDLARLGADLLVSTVSALAEGRAHETPQDEALATYAPRLTKEEGLIDWTQPAGHIHNVVRGLHPWPHAYSFLRGERVIVLQTTPRPDPAPAPPGTVVRADGDRLDVATGRGLLGIVALQPEGKRPMTARQFLSGRSLGAGDRFDARS